MAWADKREKPLNNGLSSSYCQLLSSYSVPEQVAVPMHHQAKSQYNYNSQQIMNILLCITYFIVGSIIMIFPILNKYPIHCSFKRRFPDSLLPCFDFLEYRNVSRGEPWYSVLQNNNSVQPAIFSREEGIQKLSHAALPILYYFISICFFIFRLCHDLHRFSQPSKRLWPIITFLCSQCLYLSLKNHL